MGEINVPGHILPSLIEASKMLHITGLEDMHFPEVMKLASVDLLSKGSPVIILNCFAETYTQRSKQ